MIKPNIQTDGVPMKDEQMQTIEHFLSLDSEKYPFVRQVDIGLRKKVIQAADKYEFDIKVEMVHNHWQLKILCDSLSGCKEYLQGILLSKLNKELETNFSSGSDSE
jgi:hypothetical protein